MIKFFRHIRQKLLANNQLGKYLLYALGEIVLVVIGILIALQINNSNELRKANKKELNLYSNLKIDFEFRLNELKEFNRLREKTTKDLLRLNQIISDVNNRPSDEELDAIIATTLNGFKFNEAFEMLDVVFNTGLINDIKNEDLKRKLIDWPQQVEEMLEEQRMIDDFNLNHYLPLIAKYISLRDVYEKFDFRQYNIPKGEPVTLSKNYAGLLADPLLENGLVTLQVLININYMDALTLISSAEEIIELINNELGK